MGCQQRPRFFLSTGHSGVSMSLLLRLLLACRAASLFLAAWFRLERGPGSLTLEIKVDAGDPEWLSGRGAAESTDWVEDGVGIGAGNIEDG